MKKQLIENVMPILGGILIAHGCYQMHPGLGFVIIGLSLIGLSCELTK